MSGAPSEAAATSGSLTIGRRNAANQAATPVMSRPNANAATLYCTIGTIREARMAGDLRAVIACPFDPAHIAIGASIACSGVCLTVVDRGGVAGDAWFAVDISGETVARSVPGRCPWRPASGALPRRPPDRGSGPARP